MITTAYEILQIAGDGGTVDFAVTWPYFETSDLVVNLRDDAAGTDVLQGLGSEYTATTPDPAPGTGTITFTTAPPSGQTVVIERATPLTQQIDYMQDGSFPSASHEEALDRATMHDQERKVDSERALMFPATDPVASRGEIPGAVTRASGYQGYSATGVPVILAAPADTTTLSVWGAAFGVLADAAAGRSELGVIKSASGTEGAKPAANVFGIGFYYSTDIERAWFSDGASWTELGIQQFPQATFPAAGTAGRVLLHTQRMALHYDDGAALQQIGPYPPWYKHGLTPSVLITGDDEFIVTPGFCRDDSNVVNMALGANLDKKYTGWAAGANSGGRADGVTRTAGRFYPVWLIAKEDGTTDAVWGRDPLATAAVAAAGYLFKRHVGWIRMETSSSFYKQVSNLDWNVVYDEPEITSKTGVSFQNSETVLDTLNDDEATVDAGYHVPTYSTLLLRWAFANITLDVSLPRSVQVRYANGFPTALGSPGIDVDWSVRPDAVTHYEVLGWPTQIRNPICNDASGDVDINLIAYQPRFISDDP
jgi:hypothetical protein